MAMCFRQSDFRVGPREALLGVIDGCPFCVAPAQFEYWSHCQLTIDDVVVAGGGDSFSLEAAEGVRFIVRSRLFAEAEAAELDAAGIGNIGNIGREHGTAAPRPKLPLSIGKGYLPGDRRRMAAAGERGVATRTRRSCSG